MTTPDTPPPPKKKHTYRVPLEYDADERRDFANMVGMLGREWGSVGDVGGIVLRALREAAKRT